MLPHIRQQIRRFREHFPFLNNFYEWGCGRKFPIFLDFQIHPEPRYGYTLPAHQPLANLLCRQSERYRDAFRELLGFADDFAGIKPTFSGDPALPFWDNGMLPSLDAMALMMFLVKLNPRRYIEIGSGNSTKFARYAIEKHGLRTSILSIDPQPREEIDALCDEQFRGRLEEQDVSLFSQLEAGDVVFLDGSHLVFSNSDTVVFFLEILPRLPAGVWVQIHDIVWPQDYPPFNASRQYYAEQYLLAAYLLGGGDRVDIQLPVFYACHYLKLIDMLDPIFDCENLQGIKRGGASFWFSTNGNGAPQ